MSNKNKFKTSNNVSVESTENTSQIENSVSEEELLEPTRMPRGKPSYDTYAYSLVYRDGTYQAIEIPFNSKTLEFDAPRVIEKNTDKFIIQERIQIKLFENDLA